MFLVKSAIVANEPLSAECWRMTLDASPIASQVKPGQFVHIRIGETNDPLLRRPFSVFRTVKLDTSELAIQIVYKVTGRGTRLMTGLRRGDQVDMIGPLGHAFEWYRDKETHVLVGGGTGSASLFLLGEDIAGARKKLHILLGAGTGECLILEEEFAALKGDLLVATDDGTRGYRGLVTEMLEDALNQGKITPDCAIYACGPSPMLKSLASICRQRDIPAQVAIEKHMMCGIGACLVCVCKVNKK